MGLVDYSSSSGDEVLPDSPPCKRHKRKAEPNGEQESTMPPLPATFHDLYASTVRQSVVDDPSLHQGRKRQNPHVVGHWPSHIYVEWHPTTTQHDTLDALMKKTQTQIGGDIHLHNFLTSDLGTPLPLHISLSKPLSLPTSKKDDFFSKIQDAIYTSGVGRFSVKPAGLAWYRSPDSDRTFFVLRVITTRELSSQNTDDKKKPLRLSTNPELMAILVKCNKAAAHFGQPPLYQQSAGDAVDTAFHVSIGWTMGSPDEETCLMVLKNFRDAQFGQIRDWEIDVDGVKAKIGNIITHVPLSRRGDGQKGSEEPDSLFGF
ncbi:hypothetical protein C2857_007741 [Epichloe festucae Fl1]|uniref:U6 snRNA phosphodiesterase n=1 Tax=Epichloe festucae (strain Fl1) TaxID=877507 RepID=A0A7S9KMP5_EPIFF|nr:hypothetical protein C2857_007741 [Epichloe festucae Fl1]